MTDNSNPASARTPAKAQRVLVLQGGGALGSYQAGAYQALCHHDFEPEWIAGISIGAINAAIIAGNPPEKRVERLKEFWEMVSSPVPWNPIASGDRGRSLFNETSAARSAEHTSELQSRQYLHSFPTRRSSDLERLKEFWEMVSSPVPWNPIASGDRGRSLFNETSAALIATFGGPCFFTPRVPPAPLWPQGSSQSQ